MNAARAFMHRVYRSQEMACPLVNCQSCREVVVPVIDEESERLERRAYIVRMAAQRLWMNPDAVEAWQARDIPEWLTIAGRLDFQRWRVLSGRLDEWSGCP